MKIRPGATTFFQKVVKTISRTGNLFSSFFSPLPPGGGAWQLWLIFGGTGDTAESFLEYTGLGTFAPEKRCSIRHDCIFFLSWGGGWRKGVWIPKSV